MSMFENWKACVVADSKLTRENDCWFDFRGKQIASLTQPAEFTNLDNDYVLLGYRHLGYAGDIYYDLLHFKGNPDIQNLQQQLVTLLNISTPPGIVPEILAFGKLGLIEHGAREMTLTVDDYEFADLFEKEGDVEFDSVILTTESLTHLEDSFWRLYDSGGQESESDS